VVKFVASKWKKNSVPRINLVEDAMEGQSPHFEETGHPV